MSTKTLTLKHPVEWGKESKTQIAELVFRRPKGKDLYNMPVSPKTKDLADLGGKLLVGDTPAVIIGELDVEDFMAAMELVGNFIDPTPETGEAPGV